MKKSTFAFFFLNYRGCHGFRLTKKYYINNIILHSSYNFEASTIFGGMYGCSKNWLEHKNLLTASKLNHVKIVSIRVPIIQYRRIIQKEPEIYVTIKLAPRLKRASKWIFVHLQIKTDHVAVQRFPQWHNHLGLEYSSLNKKVLLGSSINGIKISITQY